MSSISKKKSTRKKSKFPPKSLSEPMNLEEKDPLSKKEDIKGGRFWLGRKGGAKEGGERR